VLVYTCGIILPTVAPGDQ